MTTLEHLTTLDIYNAPVDYRKTSIVCTIGPKTNSVEKLSQLGKAGMNVSALAEAAIDGPVADPLASE